MRNNVVLLMCLLFSTTSAASEADSSYHAPGTHFHPGIRGFGCDATTSLVLYGFDTRLDIDLVAFQSDRSSLGIRLGFDRYLKGFRSNNPGYPAMQKYEAVLRYTTGRSTSISFFLGYASYDRYSDGWMRWPAVGAEIRWSLIAPYLGMVARLSPLNYEGLIQLGISLGYFP